MRSLEETDKMASSFLAYGARARAGVRGALTAPTRLERRSHLGRAAWLRAAVRSPLSLGRLRPAAPTSMWAPKGEEKRARVSDACAINSCARLASGKRARCGPATRTARQERQRTGILRAQQQGPWMSSTCSALSGGASVMSPTSGDGRGPSTRRRATRPLPRQSCANHLAGVPNLRAPPPGVAPCGRLRAATC